MPKPQQHDFTMRHPRVVEVRIFVNTSDSIEEVGARITKAARGARCDASVAMVKDYDGDDAKRVWETLANAAAEGYANPKAQEVDGDWKAK